MANYSFLKEAKVYIVYGATKLQLDISTVSFSQTFTEEPYPVKTIHTPNNLFEASVIKKANPANFELNIPIYIENGIRIIFDRLIDIASFDLYVETPQDTFKLQNCIITNGTFKIERSRPLSLTVAGDASKLLTGQSVPAGMVLRTSGTTRTYNLSSDLSILLNGEISSHLQNISVELKNDINWIPYQTVQQGIGNNIAYPTQHTVENRTLSGNITRYLNDDTESSAQSTGLNQSLRIKAGTEISGTFYGFDINMTSCSFTNRVETGDVFRQSYDWRMTQNTSSLTGILTYITQ
jgi:hypothetical protein|tara:strand:+ start:2011 stop:2892 length:882 start_codon:yes stop_codon:yes gene_type:complete